MKKILLVCPALPEDMPYLRQYLDFLDSSNITYDVVYLCRSCERVSYPDNYCSYSILSSTRQNMIKKLWEYYKYSSFVVNKLTKGNYTHIITMGIACSVFLTNYLKKNFRFKYIYDIRDYSQALCIPFLRYSNSVLLKNSFMNVISSEGFKRWLPTGYEYTLCHNTTLENLNKGTITTFKTNFSNIIKVLTIGQIRDFEANTFVIEQLCKSDKFELIFSGKGVTLNSLEEYVKVGGYRNVTFTGKYKKEEEDLIVESTTFINVCMGSNMVSDHLLSNRLYLAARLKKPLISFSGCYQAEIIKNYNMGVIIERTDDVSERIMEYINCFDSELFINGCERFLRDVRLDLQIFSDRLKFFMNTCKQ